MEFARAIPFLPARRFRPFVFAFVVLLIFCPSQRAHSQPPAQLITRVVPSEQARDEMYRRIAADADALEQQFGLLKRVISVVRPTVVHIEATKIDRTQPRFGPRGRTEEAGSGVIARLDNKLVVLTNRHVIKYSDPSEIKIKLSDQRMIHPSKVWGDQATDIAVMAVEEKDLSPARLGDSSKAQIGDFVLAFGSPFGLSQSVTYGIVSAKGRWDLELGEEGVRFQNFIQTDAAINPGNSGGPLINLRGEVVGINTAIASASGGNEGIGFSIPINVVTSIASQLVKNDGKVERAFLGVGLDRTYNDEEAAKLGLLEAKGTRVSRVEPDSPAAKAEIQVGDVIIDFNGTRIEDDDHLVNLVGLTDIRREVPLVVIRDKKLVKLTVRVGKLPTP